MKYSWRYNDEYTTGGVCGMFRSHVTDDDGYVLESHWKCLPEHLLGIHDETTA